MDTTVKDILGGLDAAQKVENALVNERAEMRVAWQSIKGELDDTIARRDAMAQIVEVQSRMLRSLVARLPKYANRPVTPALPDYWLMREGGGFRLRGDFAGELERRGRAAAAYLSEAENKLFGAAQRRNAAIELDGLRVIIEGLNLASGRLQEEAAELLERKDREISRLRQRGEARLAEAIEAWQRAEEDLPAGMLPWSHPKWGAWSPRVAHPSVYVGQAVAPADDGLGDNREFGKGTLIPCWATPLDGMHIIHRASSRAKAHGLARSVLLRALSADQPGSLHLSVFDPTGLGESVSPILGLAEYDPELLGGKIWSSSADLKAKLAEQTAHIELVIQKYLRSDYKSISDFNAAAGEIAEPYRLVVVFDFPEGFDEASFQDLRRIVESGPRCGVGTLLVTNQEAELPYGVTLEPMLKALWRLDVDARMGVGSSGAIQNFDFAVDSDADASPAVVQAIVNQVGEWAQGTSSRSVDAATTFSLFAAEARRGVKARYPRLSTEVDFGQAQTWWSESTVPGASAPIGLAGARDAAVLTLDSSDHSGALLVGRPGSGKSTLFHTFIAGLTTLYSPEELELHLIDFKEGVEFKVYAANGLPHARSVAIESDREFGLSVLQAIQSELNWRGNLLRDTAGAHASFETLRKSTGERLPRIVLIFDEFQVLFSQNDKVGAQAADLMESLIRQGRGFGIHVILGSQSLSGLDALGNHVPQLLPVRILLPANESDAFRVLGEGNTAGSLLTKAGEGVLNHAGGASEANQPFRGAILSEDARTERVQAMRELADSRGFSRRPIVFEGNAPIPAENTTPEQFADEVRGGDERSVRLRFGAPMAITGTADIDLKREGGANILLVARERGGDESGAGVSGFSLPRALMSNFVASGAAKGLRLEVVDFTAIDDGFDSVLEPYLSAEAIQATRRRQVPALLNELSELVSARIDSDDTQAASIVLMLYGMHRARDFDRSSVDYGGEEDLEATLRQIVRDGPEVGVHTLAWFETVNSIGRRLSAEVVREFSWRLAGRMSGDDALSLVGVEAPSSLRNQQVLVVNEDLGVVRRCSALSEAPAPWVNDLLALRESKKE